MSTKFVVAVDIPVLGTAPVARTGFVRIYSRNSLVYSKDENGLEQLLTNVLAPPSSGGVVTSEKLTYDSFNTAKKAVDAAAIVVTSSDTNKKSVETVIAAVLSAPQETAKKATETGISKVTATPQETAKKAVDAAAIVIAQSDTAKKAIEVQATIIAASDTAKKATETGISKITATPQETAKKAIEQITAIIAAAKDTAKKATDSETILVNYNGYANANVSTTNWTVPANFLGNTTTTDALLTAAASGIGGLTSTTVTGIIDVGFNDPLITDLPITNTAVINVERAIVSAGTLPLAQSASMAWQYTLDGTTWTNIQAPDVAAVAKGVISAALGASPTLSLVDSSSNAKTLTLSGTVLPVTSKTSGFNGAAQFSGNLSNNLYLTNAQSVIFAPTSGNGDRTYECRFTPVTADLTGDITLFGTSSDATVSSPADWEMRLSTQNGTTPSRVAFVYGTANGTVATVYGITNLSSGNEYIFSSTGLANGVISLYLNGVLEATFGSGGNGYSATAPTTPFYLGRSNTNRAFNGVIDEVRISSSLRYTANYTPATAPFTSDANTLALYHLDTVTPSSVITYTALNNLRVRGNGSVTSGTGLGASLEAQAYRAWVSFTASKGY